MGATAFQRRRRELAAQADQEQEQGNINVQNSVDIDTGEVIGFCSIVPESGEEHAFGDVFYTFVEGDLERLVFKKVDPQPTFLDSEQEEREIRAKAKELGIKSYHLKKIETLKEEIAELTKE
jgi:hypothetical protein